MDPTNASQALKDVTEVKVHRGGKQIVVPNTDVVVSPKAAPKGHVARPQPVRSHEGAAAQPLHSVPGPVHDCGCV